MFIETEPGPPEEPGKLPPNVQELKVREEPKRVSVKEEPLGKIDVPWNVAEPDFTWNVPECVKGTEQTKAPASIFSIRPELVSELAPVQLFQLPLRMRSVPELENANVWK